MYKSRNIISTIVIASFSKAAIAASLGIPSANVPSGYDRITTESGITCESTIASDTYVQAGLMGTTQGSDYSTSSSYNHNNMKDRDEIGAYVQIVVPIGAKRERLNCKRFEQLEIDRLKAENEKLKAALTMPVNTWDYYEAEEEEAEPVAPASKKETITIDSQRGSAAFENGSDRLRFSRLNEFDQALKTLKEYPQSKVTVIGHTDSIGSKEYNKRLSEKRAESVAEYFVSQGVDKNRISFEGYGEEHPIESNDTKEGRERNRRVEIVIESFTVEQ